MQGMYYQSTLLSCLNDCTNYHQSLANPAVPTRPVWLPLAFHLLDNDARPCKGSSNWLRRSVRPFEIVYDMDNYAGNQNDYTKLILGGFAVEFWKDDPD